MPADHPICTTSLGLTPDPANKACHYNLSNTEGLYGFDTFTLLSMKKQKLITVPSVAFGVGVLNQMNMFHDPSGNNPIGGFLGLGRDQPSSVLNQLAVGKFSYCLPRRFGDQALFYMGNDIKADYTGPYVQSTPILGSKHDSYYLKLEAISINGTALPIAQKVLSRNGKGIVIDCGSPYSSFVDETYDVMVVSVKNYFKHYGGELALVFWTNGLWQML